MTICMLSCDHMDKVSRLFGSEPRTRVLLAVALLENSYPRELARALTVPLPTVQRVLADFEREGVLASRMLGQNRLYSLNRHQHGSSDLEAFLKKFALGTDVPEALQSIRRRPRRAGKEI